MRVALMSMQRISIILTGIQATKKYVGSIKCCLSLGNARAHYEGCLNANTVYRWSMSKCHFGSGTNFRSRFSNADKTDMKQLALFSFSLSFSCSSFLTTIWTLLSTLLVLPILVIASIVCWPRILLSQWRKRKLIDYELKLRFAKLVSVKQCKHI